MKKYFVETNGDNMVVVKIGEKAYIYDTDSKGKLWDIDLYGEKTETLKQLATIDVDAQTVAEYGDSNPDKVCAWAEIETDDYNLTEI